jgi:hypothetical protein
MASNESKWTRRRFGPNDRFNKTETDFSTLLDYNNYLEEVEDISESQQTHNLLHHVTCRHAKFGVFPNSHASFLYSL